MRIYHYHVVFENNKIFGRDKISLIHKIVSDNYDQQLQLMETLLKDKWHSDCVVTHFQLLED